ncbi:hypothetical protein NQ315_007476, partial [Exocentrus adspersus]
MRFFSLEKNCFVTVPSVKNLIHTVEGFIYLKSILLSKFKLKFILTRFFNQDPLENFFSYIRSHNARNVSPGVSHFISSFKSLLITNFMAYHSRFSNCEKDESSQLLSFVAKKVDNILKKVQMQNFSDTDFIEAREYTRNLLKRPGGFVTFLVSEAVPRLYFLIPRLAHKRKISLILKQILFKIINFDPINCRNHNLKNTLCDFLIKCALHFWCEKVNKIARGQDSKFAKYYKNCVNKNNIDPVKVRALKKCENKRKLKNVYKNKPS